MKNTPVRHCSALLVVEHSKMRLGTYILFKHPTSGRLHTMKYPAVSTPWLGIIATNAMSRLRAMHGKLFVGRSGGSPD